MSSADGVTAPITLTAKPALTAVIADRTMIFRRAFLNEFMGVEMVKGCQ